MAVIKIEYGGTYAADTVARTVKVWGTDVRITSRRVGKVLKLADEKVASQHQKEIAEAVRHGPGSS